MTSFRTYYQLVKPGVLYGNVITGIAGFLLAASYFERFYWGLFIAAIGGMTLVIASACALNNYLDQDIDRIMQRTRSRGVASGDIPGWQAVWIAIVLAVCGFVILALWTNWLVFGIGVVGYVTYVWLYGALSKRRSVHGTLVGSVSGAFPILAGYCAVDGHLDVAAVLLFLALFFWQFPEFYSISIYRRTEYAAAGVPLMSVVKGVRSTTWQLMIYTFCASICLLLLTPLGYTGFIYFAVTLPLCVRWCLLAIIGLHVNNSENWSRRMFHHSIMLLLVFSLLISVGGWLA